MATFDLLRFWDTEKKQLKSSLELWEELKNLIVADFGTPEQNEMDGFTWVNEFGREYALSLSELRVGDPRLPKLSVMFETSDLLLLNEYTEHYRSISEIFNTDIDISDFSLSYIIQDIIVDMIFECVIINARTYGGIE